MDVRWNSTYLMLKHLVPYKNTFSIYISANYHVAGESLLTKDHWYVAKHILNFLGLYYLSTVSISGVYYPTSPLMMHAIIEIADHLSTIALLVSMSIHNLEMVLIRLVVNLEVVVVVLVVKDH
jgi:hypothetical protein